MSPGPDLSASDSAGNPWEGRRFETNPHAADDGSADPDLWAALTAFTSGTGDQVAVVDAYRRARLLIPLVAARGATEDSADDPDKAPGVATDKTQELSIVTVAAPDGRAVLPVFTSVSTMATWDAAARPVPADGVRTALAAAADGTELIVIDPGSPTEFVLRRPAVWAVGAQQPWEPSFVSPEVYAGLHDSIAGELAVLDLRVRPGDANARLRGPELNVRLELFPGLDRSELDAVLARLARRWATDDRIAVLVDSLSVTVDTAPLPREPGVR